MSARVRIGQLDVDVVTFDETLTRIAELVERGRGGAVFPPNVDHVMLAERSAPLRAAYAHASLSLADGMPAVWASRLLGTPLPAKISGSDLMGPLLALAGERHWRVYLLGGAAGVALEAAQVARARYGANIVGIDDTVIDPHGGPGEDAVVTRIVESRADLLLVALGCPKQELFIVRNRAGLGRVVALGIGASLDFVTGRVARAPAWMSRAGLEWIYRLGQEPRRLWRRYLVQDTQFAFVLLRMLRERRRGAVAPSPDR